MSRIGIYIGHPIWLTNRVIVRRKGAKAPLFVLRRLRLAETRQTSTVQLVPYEMCNKPSQWDATAITLSVGEVEDHYEPAGRSVGVMRAPL